MSRSAAIRAFVQANGPCQFGPIADAFAAKTRRERLHIHWTVAVMCRDGLLAKSGKARSLFYTYVREPVPQAKFTPAEKTARRKEQEAARRRQRGIQPRAEFLAKVRKEATVRKVERSSETRARAERKPSVTKPVKVITPRANSIVLQPAAPSLSQVAPAKPRLETSDEWMARTGLAPKVLPVPMAVKPWEPLPKQRKKAE